MRLALEKLSPPLPPAQLEAALAELVRLKQQLYVEKYLSQVRLRPGVRNLIAEAVQRQVRLAIVSISAESQIEGMLRRHLPEFAGHFNPILGKQAGPKIAPDSPLYRRCLAALGTTPAETLAIEDSEGGWRAAQTVGLAGAVIYNDYTFGQNFAGAALVARSLEFFDLDRLVDLCLPS
jgi:HAD superfamily hydrolase (TIGR01509 family)